ncbi:MAG TPA: DUF2793 domain-containing protein [Gammaproteobacteria bacterium]|nr:DUF2793 domain-containing protein [Gammaproteobacteria bacterium]
MFEFWVYIALTAIQIIATKAPEGPKAANFNELEVPQAEEGRPLSVIFGRVRIRDFNAIWYGDYGYLQNKLRQGFKKRVTSIDYFVKLHLALCIGPVNYVGLPTYNDRKISPTGMLDVSTATQTLTLTENRYYKDTLLISPPTFTLNGTLRIYPGHDDQAIPAQWKSITDNNAYRGVVMAQVHQPGMNRGVYIGQQPRVLLMTFDIERTTAGWQDNAPWYPERLEISRDAKNGYSAYKEMNPAHILYETLTNKRWGMGADIALIDDASFRAAADQLYNEAFGMSIEWAAEQTIGQFVDRVCDHIRGGVRFNESVGKFQLVLFRADYVVENLPVYTPANSKLLRYAASGNIERVNRVDLTYTDTKLFKPTVITAQDQGAQLSQQADIPIPVNREGITDLDTAKLVLGWEMHARVAPLSTIAIEVDRRARGLGFSGVFVYTEPEHHSTPRVYRATKVQNNPLDKNTIIIEAAADIFAQQTEGWTIGEPQTPGDPVTPPEPPDDEEDSGTVVIIPPSTTPPVTPTAGDTYVVPSGATGDWAGHDGETATFVPGNGEDGGSWEFEPIPDHTFLFDSVSQTWKEYYGGTLHEAPWRLRIRDTFDDPDEIIDDTKEILFHDALVTSGGPGVANVNYAPPVEILTEDLAPADEDMIIVRKASGGYRKVAIGSLTVSGGSGDFSAMEDLSVIYEVLAMPDTLGYSMYTLNYI